MPIEVKYEPNHLQLVLSVLPKAFLSGKRLSQAVDQLFEALQVIRGQMTDSDIYYFALDVGNLHRKGEEFSPWTNEALEMWGRVAQATHLHGRLKLDLSRFRSGHLLMLSGLTFEGHGALPSQG